MICESKKIVELMPTIDTETIETGPGTGALNLRRFRYGLSGGMISMMSFRNDECGMLNDE
jgi:hypothetical protein